jgi:hypothetical protein
MSPTQRTVRAEKSIGGEKAPAGKERKAFFFEKKKQKSF